MKVKYELLQVFPPTDDWVVLHYDADTKTYTWEPVYAMAQIKETWAVDKYDEDIPSGYTNGLRVVFAILPLVTSQLDCGLIVPGQTEDFGTWMSADGLSIYTLTHWSQVREHTAHFRVKNTAGLSDWLSAHGGNVERF